MGSTFSVYPSNVDRFLFSLEKSHGFDKHLGSLYSFIFTVQLKSLPNILDIFHLDFEKLYQTKKSWFPKCHFKHLWYTCVAFNLFSLSLIIKLTVSYWYYQHQHGGLWQSQIAQIHSRSLWNYWNHSTRIQSKVPPVCSHQLAKIAVTYIL